VKQYEALFILHNPDKEDGIKETVDSITQEITANGGRVDNVQKMDRKSFTRVASQKVTSGFYVNLIFTVPEANINSLRHRFTTMGDVFRVMITEGSSAATPA